MPSDGKSSHCLWQGELKKDKRFGFMVFNATFNDISAISSQRTMIYKLHRKLKVPQHDPLNNYG